MTDGVSSAAESSADPWVGSLTAAEGRVLGCLIEKERTVADQYPLTMNALVAACNQSTSRHPVMSLGEGDVDSAMVRLKESGWGGRVLPSHGSRVIKYRHRCDQQLLQRLGAVPADDDLLPSAQAVLAVLLLRGPQTTAELRSRCERLWVFADLVAVDATLQTLQQLGLAHRLERQPGEKEPRWQQRLAIEADAVAPSAGSAVSAAAPSAAEASVLTDRIADLEARVLRLEQALGDLLGDDN